MRQLPTFASTITALLVAATVPLLSGCEASLTARTPAEARLPAPTPDDPGATDPGVTGRTGAAPLVADAPFGDPDAAGSRADAPTTAAQPGDPMPGEPRPAGTAPGAPIGPATTTGREMPGTPRPEPGGPRLADRPSEWPPGGVAKSEGMPPPPPPPDWDPALDGRVRRQPGAPRTSAQPIETPPVTSGSGMRPLEPMRGGGSRAPSVADTGDDLPPTGALPPIETPRGTAPTGPAGTASGGSARGGTAAAGGTPSVPARPRDPLLPDTPSSAPPAADASDDLGAPPGGSMPNPMGPGDPPVVPTEPVPTEPVPTEPVPSEPVPTEPAPTEPVPTEPVPSEPVPSEPAPTEPVPSVPVPTEPQPADPMPTDPPPADDDPWLPGGSDRPEPVDPQPVDPQPVDPKPVDPKPADDDPWSPGGSSTAPTDPPPSEPRPADPQPADPQPADDDPWLPGGASSAGSGTGSTAPTPVDPQPTSAMGRTMAHVTKLLDRPGRPDVRGYPADIVRLDAPGIALTPGPRPVLIVFFDDAMRASDLQAAQLLPMIARLRDRIDVVAIDRGANAERTRGGDELSLRFLDHVPTTVVLDGQRTTRLLRSGRVDASVVERAIEQAIANPTPAGDPSADPSGTRPDVPPSPGASDAPQPPGEPDGVDPWQDEPTGTQPPAEGDGERGGVTFTPPSNYSARAHVQRLRSAPGDAKVPGYPSDILRSAPAARVFASSTKPCVILFYDDASKASDLQAAAYLELLVRRVGEIDLVLVDVGPKASWDADEKRVVRTYFNHYVPTTVVLTGARAPVKAWYSRVEASALDDAIDDALSR